MTKQYDLEERTQKFAADVRSFVRSVELDLANREDAKQLVRASGSVAANYIEANEAVSRKDFGYRIKICRKEVKESKLWLNLIWEDSEQTNEKKKLAQEATELLKIFSSILSKTGLNEPEVSYDSFEN
jgi:four helix bundle protein